MNDNRLDVSYPPVVNLAADPRATGNLSASNAVLGGPSVDKNFIFVQRIAETIWVIQHPLNKFPSVTIIDSGGNVVIGNVQYISTNEVRCFFSAPFAGKAYLN